MIRIETPGHTQFTNYCWSQSATFGPARLARSTFVPACRHRDRLSGRSHRRITEADRAARECASVPSRDHL